MILDSTAVSSGSTRPLNALDPAMMAGSMAVAATIARNQVEATVEAMVCSDFTCSVCMQLNSRTGGGSGSGGYGGE